MLNEAGPEIHVVRYPVSDSVKKPVEKHKASTYDSSPVLLPYLW